MKSIFSLILIFFSFTLFQNKVNAQSVYPKKLIQFGWDYPTISFLKTHLPAMQKQPFDGITYSFDFRIYDLFDTTLYPDKVFQLNDLASLDWGDFSDNFLRVRAQSLNGANWTNDQAWDNIIHNIQQISQALKVSGSKGIFFDPEYYYQHLPDKNPWIYNNKIYPGMTYNEVGQYVRKRGKQFIEALQYYKSDPVILSFYLLSLVTLQARQKPLERTGMALYPFFVEGMMERKNSGTDLIDGNELGFSYRSERQFVFSGEELRQWGSNFMPDSLKAIYNETTISQPVFYDRIYATFPQYDEKFDLKQKANWLYSNLYYALKTSDKYVWFYNNKIDWWRKRNDTVAGIIRSVEKRVRAEYNNKKNTLSGNSSLMNFVKLAADTNSGFSYSFSKSSNLLKVNFSPPDITYFYVFENSKLLYTIINPSKSLNIVLDKFTGKGNLILASIDKKGRYSYAFLN